MMETASFIVHLWIAVVLTCMLFGKGGGLLIDFIRHVVKAWKEVQEETKERERDEEKLREMYKEVKEAKEKEWNARN